MSQLNKPNISDDTKQQIRTIIADLNQGKLHRKIDSSSELLKKKSDAKNRLRRWLLKLRSKRNG